MRWNKSTERRWRSDCDVAPGIVEKMSIKTLSSRLVYENRWMKLHEDEIERAGGTKGIYGVVTKPDFAIIVPVLGDDFIFVEQFRYTMQRRCLEFPQGTWDDRPDVNPEELARGELKEETGFEAKTLRYLGKYQSAYGFVRQAFHVYLAMDLVQGATSLDAEESDLVTRRIPI
jgi:ADP-ribose pyrophosphatase